MIVLCGILLTSGHGRMLLATRRVSVPLIDDRGPSLIDDQHESAMFQWSLGVSRVVSQILGKLCEPERN